MQRKPKDEARRARNELYRKHILDAAEKVFAERGFENAKVQEISELAGLSMGTIYSIFTGKEELFTALLEERGRELLALAREIASRNDPAWQALNGLIEGYIGYFVTHPTFLQMHLNMGTSWVLRPRPDTETQVQIWQEIHAYQTDIFRRGIEEGVFIEEDPAFLAKMFSAMDQVILAEWAAGGMKTDRGDLVKRLRAMIERTFSRSPSNP